MKAIDTAKLAQELLEYLETKQIRGEEKVAALRSAAAIMEAVQQGEITKQTSAAILSSILHPRK